LSKGEADFTRLGMAWVGWKEAEAEMALSFSIHSNNLFGGILCHIGPLNICWGGGPR
jgi:hypothetical protein